MNKLKPEFGLLFYQNDDNNNYIEKFNIDSKGCVTKYEPLTIDAYKELLNGCAVNNKENFKYSFEQKVCHLEISLNSFSVGWVVKSALRPFITSTRKRNLIYPHIYFLLKDDNLYLYAIKKPCITSKTIFYKLPLPNIYGDNRMCVGNMKLKDFIFKDINKTMNKIEFMFFNSYFNDYLRKNDFKVNTHTELNKAIKEKRKINEKNFIKTKLK